MPAPSNPGPRADRQEISVWDRVAQMDDFKKLLAARKAFVIPATIFFVVYYFALPISVGYFPAFMQRKVSGPVTFPISWRSAIPGRLADRLFLRSRRAQFRRLWRDRQQGSRAHRRQGKLADDDYSCSFPRVHRRHPRNHLLGRQPFRRRASYFAAGRRITGWQNGIAVAGDYMSAASFLGIAGIIAFQATTVSLLRRLARRVPHGACSSSPNRCATPANTPWPTCSPIACSPRPVRAMASLSTLTVSTFYMIAQMVGAGALVRCCSKAPASATTRP